MHRVSNGMREGVVMRIPPALVCAVFALTIVSSALAEPRSDAEIKAQLERRVRALALTLEVRDGVVTITGTVQNLAQKLSILGIARRTIGVKEIVDRITVIPPQKRTDEQIAKSVRSALAHNLSKEEFAAISVRAEKAVVILTGTLSSSYPKQLAGTLASWAPGVVDVRNGIVVRPSVSRTDPEIQAEVRERFRRNVFISSQQINISVANGIVTLTGIVDRLLEAEQAEAVARFTPGVVDVRNLLFVRGPET